MVSVLVLLVLMSPSDSHLIEGGIDGYQAHEGERINTLINPYPTDPSLSVPLSGYPANSGVEPVRVMMNESSDIDNGDARLLRGKKPTRSDR
jgi:hypothetical protein